MGGEISGWGAKTCERGCASRRKRLNSWAGDPAGAGVRAVRTAAERCKIVQIPRGFPLIDAISREFRTPAALSAVPRNRGITAE